MTPILAGYSRVDGEISFHPTPFFIHPYNPTSQPPTIHLPSFLSTSSSISSIPSSVLSFSTSISSFPSTLSLFYDFDFVESKSDHLQFEKKRQHIEYMREQKRRFEEDMKLLDLQHEREKTEMDQLARDLAKAGLSGPVSEPTTPPEYREPPMSSAVSSAVSRPSRFSTSSVTSSPGFFNAFGPSSQLTSPQAPANPTHQSAQSVDRFAGHSLPGSRRNSEKEDFTMEASTFRPGPS